MEPVPGSEDHALLPLRSELRLYPASAEEGRPGWTLEDPVRNRFFRLGRHQVEQLARWDSGTTRQLHQRLVTETGLSIDQNEIAQFQQFLLANFLLQPGHPLVQRLLEKHACKKSSLWARVLQSFIFFRVPLWRPQRFLTRTLPAVRFLATPLALVFFTVLLLVALILLTPQWNAFFNSFSFFISWQGAASYIVALFLVKLLHELGHAYTATAYGIKVPVIGLAFIVLWPMLYSDNTDAWREQDRRVRMKIVLAGIAVELAVAAVSTFAWILLQPGILRSVCFVLATSTWLHSLLVNLNPCMRFDGYYLLSDCLGVSNLAPRAFALGRWRLRRLLWGMNITKPEFFSPRLERILTVYCYATWLYRFLLFTGIALMVYHLFFKSLGLALFAVEISMFVIKPILSELQQWWRQRESIARNGHAVITLLVLLSVITLFFVPFSTTVIIPAQLGAKQRYRVYVPFAAQLEQMYVHEGQLVKQGDLLFSLSSHLLDARKKIIDFEIKTLTVQLQRELGARHRVESTAVTQNRLTAALIEAEGLEMKMKQLQIRANFSGKVEQIAEGVEPGCWIGFGKMLCLVVSGPGEKVLGSIAENDLALLPDEIYGQFYAEAGDMERVPCMMSFIGPSNQQALEPPALASIYGGDVAVFAQPGALLRPLQNRYRIEFVVQNGVESPTSIRGHVRVDGRLLSLFSRCWRSVAPGLIRESAF